MASVIFGLFTDRNSRRFWIASAFAGSIGLLAFSHTSDIFLASGLLMGINIAATGLLLSKRTQAQLEPERGRGRAFAVFNSIASGSSALGAGLTGFFASLPGVSIVTVLSVEALSLMTLALSVGWFWGKPIRFKPVSLSATVGELWARAAVYWQTSPPESTRAVFLRKLLSTLTMVVVYATAVSAQHSGRSAILSTQA
jgi:hypothetical protein